MFYDYTVKETNNQEQRILCLQFWRITDLSFECWEVGFVKQVSRLGGCDHWVVNLTVVNFERRRCHLWILSRRPVPSWSDTALLLPDLHT